MNLHHNEIDFQNNKELAVELMMKSMLEVDGLTKKHRLALEEQLRRQEIDVDEIKKNIQ